MTSYCSVVARTAPLGFSASALCPPLLRVFVNLSGQCAPRKCAKSTGPILSSRPNELSCVMAPAGSLGVVAENQAPKQLGAHRPGDAVLAIAACGNSHIGHRFSWSQVTPLFLGVHVLPGESPISKSLQIPFNLPSLRVEP